MNESFGHTLERSGNRTRMNLWFTDSISIKRRGLITMQDAQDILKTCSMTITIIVRTVCLAN
ncbi:hypothetical protein GY14_03595 [Delftia tsuruhatensis]|uniref:Uncharacterized protein n=1 Tax=Delftia tsuruhatensis TaxID=180282 RepID=A0ABN4SMN6_9BURK|nr:hypothetical protein BI380_27575 [Delftia tsuruhatensis]KEH10645.1 hypothetical protein GY14_03595 [Delftia tsuruhatensis]